MKKEELSSKNTIPSIREVLGGGNSILSKQTITNKKKSYSDKLRNPKWQRKRLEILDRDNFTCRICGDTNTTLNVHHLEYSETPWSIDNSKLITVCEHCHISIELKKHDIVYFNSLKILKRVFESDKYISRVMFVFYDKKIIFETYDKSGINISSISFTKDTAQKLIDLFIKYLPEK